MCADVSTRQPVPMAAPGVLRAGGLTGFPGLVSELGRDPVALIAGCGLAARILDDGDNTIPFAVGARLSHVAAEQTGCSHFGLLLGRRQDLAILGPLGLLIRHCPDLRSALTCLLEYMHLQVTGARATLTTAGAVARFTYRVQLPSLIGVEQVYNVCMSYQVKLLQLLCGKQWRPEAIDFCTPPPANVRLYREFFDAPVFFNRPSSAVVFSADWLDRPIDGADRALHAILLNHVRQLDVQCRDGFPGQLRRVICTLLPTRTCTVERVSELFGMNRRTLYRSLAKHGLTFEGEVDVVRRDLAIQSLAQAQAKFSRVSQMLGYHDPSTFTRAFYRWTSMSPSEWRTTR